MFTPPEFQSTRRCGFLWFLFPHFLTKMRCRNTCRLVCLGLPVKEVAYWNYGRVLRTVRYNNVSTSPGTVPDRQITFTVSDGTLTSATAVTTLKVRATDKIGVVRPDGQGSLVFSLDTNGDGVFDAGDQVFHFGAPGDAVIVGEWNGDGRSKIGVVRPDGKVVIRKIVIDRDLGDKLQISEGISKQDQVIVNPSDGLADGIPVKVAPQPAKETAKPESTK